MTGVPGSDEDPLPATLWTALRDAPDGIAVIDPPGSIDHVNESFAAIHGVEDPTTVRETDWPTLYAEPDRARRAMATAADTGSWTGRLTGTRPAVDPAGDRGGEGVSEDGGEEGNAAGAGAGNEITRSCGIHWSQADRERFLVVDVTLSRAADGRIVCLVRDDTERARLEWYETIIEHLSDAVYTLDTEGRITYVNEYVLEQYDIGYDREELIGESVSTVLDADDINRSLEVIRELIHDPDRDSGRCEVTIPTEDRSIPAELHISLLPGTDDRIAGTVGVIRDITDRKRREQGLSVLQRVLRHNVRNETLAILGYADLLLRRAPEDMQSELEAIRSAAAGLERISEKARHVKRALDTGKTAVTTVDLTTVLAEHRDDYERQYPAADLTFDLPETAPTHTGEAVDVIIGELIENAIEHNDTETPRVRVTVTVEPNPSSDSHTTLAAEDVDTNGGRSASDTGSQKRTGTEGNQGRVLVQIDDDGPGIPDHEPSVLAEDSEGPLYHGSGLGLWLVNWFVETYGGELAFTESKWSGSSVRIALPSADPADSR